MKLFELFLVETSEEDRAIISLSAEIYKKLKKEHIGRKPTEKLIHFGKIGDLFDTSIPALDNVSIDLQGGPEFTKRAEDTAEENDVEISTVPAFWEGETNTIVLNSEFLSHAGMRTVITHELRHALDEIKSNSFPAKANSKDPKKWPSYFVPKKKEHRKEDPYSDISYRAQPAEINARFIEVLDVLSIRLPGIVDEYGDEAFDAAIKTLGTLFNRYKIADIFPEKEKSKDYKQLMKRAADFITKEINHLKTQQR